MCVTARERELRRFLAKACVLSQMGCQQIDVRGDFSSGQLCGGCSRPTEGWQIWIKYCCTEGNLKETFQGSYNICLSFHQTQRPPSSSQWRISTRGNPPPAKDVKHLHTWHSFILCLSQFHTFPAATICPLSIAPAWCQRDMLDMLDTAGTGTHLHLGCVHPSFWIVCKFVTFSPLVWFFLQKIMKFVVLNTQEDSCHLSNRSICYNPKKRQRIQEEHAGFMTFYNPMQIVLSSQWFFLLLDFITLAKHFSLKIQHSYCWTGMFWYKSAMYQRSSHTLDQDHLLFLVAMVPIWVWSQQIKRMHQAGNLTHFFNAIKPLVVNAAFTHALVWTSINQKRIMSVSSRDSYSCQKPFCLALWSNDTQAESVLMGC